MSYPETRCFFVEKVNQRTTIILGSPCPDHQHCWKTQDREQTTFDARRTDTGQIIATDTTYFGNLPPGAMYWQTFIKSSWPFPRFADDWEPIGPDVVQVRKSFAEHPNSYLQGACEKDPTLPKRTPSYIFANGPHLIVICPNGGTWNVDSRASNCTMPYDYEHRCWIRHGIPPNVTVDKNGNTCQAGAGSIKCGDYHGFLRNGVLTAG